MFEPIISIVVPAYNAEKTLKKTLLSVAIQMEQYPNCEVIIVDDGSTDATYGIISSFEKWDSRFRGVKQNNEGVSAARNKGVENAEGEYIAFLDADDLFLEGSIYERVRVLVADDDSDMLGVFCPAVFINADGEVLKSAPNFDYSLPDDRLYFAFTPDSVFNPSCVIVKKDAFLKAGRFDATITSAEDYDLWHRMMRSGGYFKKVSSCAIGWRQHDTSACHTNIVSHYKQCKIVIERIYSQSREEDVEEFRGGFGQATYFISMAERAFNSAILAVVSGQHETAREIASDISRLSLEQINSLLLENFIRQQSLRAFAKPEEEWISSVWPKIKNDVMKFISDLNKQLGENCNTLLSLIDRLCQMDAEAGIKIIYVPGFDSKEELSDQYHRMLWYINPIIEDVSKIYIPVSFDDLEELEMPSYLDHQIKKFENRFEGKIVLFPANEIELWYEYTKAAHFLINWKNDFMQSDNPVDELILSTMQTKKTWNIDQNKIRYAGSHYLRLSHDVSRSYQYDLCASKEKFQELVMTISSSKGYIFGTGPSLEKAMDYDFSDGVTMACNSMVKNTALMKHLNPEVVIFGDPIFHAGCSGYAGEFRKYLYKLMDEYNPYLIVPFRDYKLYIENIPHKYRNKIIGVPLEHIDNVNLDLKEKFVTKSTGNVLTLLLFPVACSLFSEIGIMGCDGRKIEDNQYFWQHHKASQFNEQMEGIKKAHPAFFEMDYNDYYMSHCETLEEWIFEAEKKGIQIRNLTESYIPALQKRTINAQLNRSHNNVDTVKPDENYLRYEVNNER